MPVKWSRFNSSNRSNKKIFFLFVSLNLSHFVFFHFSIKVMLMEKTRHNIRGILNKTYEQYSKLFAMTIESLSDKVKKKNNKKN